jgi:hypothetical protein
MSVALSIAGGGESCLVWFGKLRFPIWIGVRLMDEHSGLPGSRKRKALHVILQDPTS